MTEKALKYSLLFCFELVLTFTALGAASALLGRMMTGAGKWWHILLALIMQQRGCNYWESFISLPNHAKCRPDERGW